MITVNLFDGAFAHHPDCSVHGKSAKRIRYVRGRMSWPGITLLTDAMLTESNILDHLESKVKIGWLMEPREYRPTQYDRALLLLDRLDLLLTHDQALIEARPDKVRFVPFGGCWIQEKNYGLHPKTWDVSMIYSAKTFLRGHRLRHVIAATFPGIDQYGNGSPRPIALKEEGLVDYRFSVVIENSRTPNFFTEKLLDCFAVGTVPIYWGAPNIGYFFDVRGVLRLERIEDLPPILASLNYESHLEGVKANFELFKEYAVTDDWIAENILEGL